MGAIFITTLLGLLRGKAPRESLWIAAFTVPPLLAVWLYFALWWEVRVLLPVVILLLPISLSALFGPTSKHHLLRIRE